MAYRITKTHTGHTWNAAYPDPLPSNLTEFDAVFEAKSIAQLVADIDALGLTDWSTYRDDIITVLNSAPVSESFDAGTQVLTVVKDWPNKALHDQHEIFIAAVDWATVVPMISTEITAAAEV
tara:strand:+ start:9463 stop:9828 length:366 start_codon:yes stop_codon:yes gene_type:complete